ncbi:TetR/AcrR family transcriptional regulator [Humisphaera borealis]|uniref:TetR/AcrR family transcriptional regulator n=1 Tax=Humisphaera borealis TaxID=2807512 RepID=A0A7M2WYA3_9BACT|nr:TetR/AcrR family transcriptional regulator [Humisphaera borealis]QOV90334.1 TetR/AcrR family transcriptional regulator [Humisphaera borealis]
MASQDRRERERHATRTKIMDAARELFANHGFDNVSLRKIAEAIEYTPAAIYVHFADKEALFRELAHEDFKALAGICLEADQITDPLARIAAIGTGYIHFGLQHPNHYRLMFMTSKAAALGDELTCAELAKKGDPAEDGYAYLHKCVVEAAARGMLRDGLTDTHLVAQTMWAGVHGVTSLQITLHDDPWIEWATVADRIDVMVWSLVRGVAREPANYPPADLERLRVASAAHAEAKP